MDTPAGRAPDIYDPDVRALVDLMDRYNVPPMNESGVDSARRSLESLQLPPGPDMTSIENALIDGPHGTVPVRIYRPHDAPPTDSAALIWFHGGGLIMGSLDSFDRLAREVAHATGAVLVNVEYRLAPEHRYPVANDEAYATTIWLVDNATRLGIAANRIGVGGDSAGGGLAAATALRARDQNGPHLAQQVLIYPGLERRRDRPSMREFGGSPLLRATDIDWMKALYLGDDPSSDDMYGTPALAHDLTDLPPAIVVSAYADALRDGVEEYGRRLQNAGNATAIIRYPGVGHGFFMQTASIARARTAMADVGSLVRSRFTTAK